MGDKLDCIIEKYHLASDQFNEENKNKYKMRCFANFAKMRFNIYFVKLNENIDEVLQYILYIPMDALEKQSIYSVNTIYNAINKLNKEIFGDRNE